MVLDRDDRGGPTIPSPSTARRSRARSGRRPSASAASSPGEYTVNVNHYLATTGAPVPVSVKVEKVNPTVEVVHYDTISLDHTGQEKTAVRFRLADNGRSSTSTIAKIADPVDPQRPPLGEVTPARPMTTTLLAISAAYVVIGVLLLSAGAYLALCLVGEGRRDRGDLAVLRRGVLRHQGSARLAGHRPAAGPIPVVVGAGGRARSQDSAIPARSISGSRRSTRTTCRTACRGPIGCPIRARSPTAPPRRATRS